MILRRRLKILFVSLLLPLEVWAGPKDPPGNYDEVRLPDGSYRIQYSGIGEVYEKISPKRRKELLEISKARFSGDNQLNLLPRVLTEAEIGLLREGVVQRATALKLFFEDHYSGRKSYLKKKILPKAFVEQIISRHGEQDWERKIPKTALNWLYGPDIVRLADGTFAIVEDNFGSLGGLGDLVKAPETLLDLVPEYKRHLEIPNPITFYQQLANRYHERAAKNGGKAVMLQYRAEIYDDKEVYRLMDLMDGFGIETVEFDWQKPVDGRTKKFLEVKPDGVYLQRRVGGKIKSEKVGYLFIQGEVKDLDSLTGANRRSRLMAVAKSYIETLGKKADPRVAEMMRKNALGEPFAIADAEALFTEVFQKSNYHDPFMKYGSGGVPGLLEAIISGKVGANYSPGLGFVEDKEFYTVVPDLIRYYLDEIPLIQNLETKSFRKFERGKAKFDADTFDKVFANIENYVMKGVAGMGGAEVWIGKKMTAPEIEILKAKVRDAPSLFIIQEYKDLSVMEGDLVDLRLISDVGPEVGDVLTANVPWGRASPLKGSGKVNISSGGSETAVFVRKTSSLPCSKYLRH